MLQKTLFVVASALGTVLLISSRAQAWGAYHAGYTHVGPGGVQHWGRTAVAGPYGARVGGTAYGHGVSRLSGGWGYGAHYGGVGGYGGVAHPYYPYAASPYAGYYYNGFGMTGPSGGFAAGYNGP